MLSNSEDMTTGTVCYREGWLVLFLVVCFQKKFKICLKAFFLQGFPRAFCFGSIYETDGTCRTTIYGTGVKQTNNFLLLLAIVASR